MAIKMRVLYWTNKAKLKALANELKQEFELAHNAVDAIPPAYSCENERLVILGISGKGELDDMVRRFCGELNKKKAQNVAIFIDGDDKLMQNTISVLKEAGTNVIENTKLVKFGGLPFIGGKLSDSECQEYIAWAHEIVDSIK